MISYPLYPVHYVLLQGARPALTDPGRRLSGPAEPPPVAGYPAWPIGLSRVAHRYVERPGQRLGRRLAAGRRVRGLKDEVTA